MNFNFRFESKQSQSIIDVIAHPDNEEYVYQHFKNDQHAIHVIDPKTNRKLMVPLKEIEMISTFTHLSKVWMVDGDIYYLKGRLKDLTALENDQIVRTSNNEMVNLREVINYSIDKGARLIMTCKSGNQYRVSRYYAKKIKEVFKCSHF